MGCGFGRSEYTPCSGICHMYREMESSTGHESGSISRLHGRCRTPDLPLRLDSLAGHPPQVVEPSEYPAVIASNRACWLPEPSAYPDPTSVNALQRSNRSTSMIPLGRYSLQRSPRVHRAEPDGLPSLLSNDSLKCVPAQRGTRGKSVSPCWVSSKHRSCAGTPPLELQRISHPSYQ